MRQFIVGLLAVAFVFVGAGTASARPVIDEPRYTGPGYGTASYFAGLSVSGCADSYKVYGEGKKRC